MADSTKPLPEHIAAAAEELDNIHFVAQKMTVASSENRQLLFKLTRIPIENLLQLNQRHFGNSDSIRGRIAMLANELLTLRNLGAGQITGECLEGSGNCPHCETPVQQCQPQKDPLPNDPWINYCPACTVFIGKAIERLTVPHVGFGIADR